MRFRWLVLLGALGLLLAGCQPAVKTAENNTTTEPETKTDDVGSDTTTEPEVEEPAPPTYDSLSGEFNEKMNAFIKAVRSAPPAERRAIINEKRPDPNEFAGKFMELAESKGDSPEAMNSLMWIVSNIRGPSGGGVDYASQAIDTLVSRFKDSEGIGNVLPMLAGRPEPKTHEVLTELAENSPHKSVQGIAKMAMFEFDKLVAQIKELGDEAARMGIPEDQVTFFANATLMSDDDKMSLMKDLAENYPGVTYGEQVSGRRPVESLADMAKTQLFVIEHLSIGKEAPEIEGVDLFGEEFKLSEYRGKVVMLDFWGDW